MQMTNLFRQTKFNACHGYLRRQLADFADKFGRLKASAVLLYEHECHVRTTISNEGIKNISLVGHKISAQSIMHNGPEHKQSIK